MARVNKGSHSYACHPHVYQLVKYTIPGFTPQPQSITALWLVLISRPAEGRRLSWPIADLFVDRLGAAVVARLSSCAAGPDTKPTVSKYTWYKTVNVHVV